MGGGGGGSINISVKTGLPLYYRQPFVCCSIQSHVTTNKTAQTAVNVPIWFWLGPIKSSPPPPHFGD